MANNPFDPPIVQVKKTLNRGGLGTVNRGYGSLKSSTQKTRQAPPAEQPEWWPENLSELGDVDTVTNPPTNGQVLLWNGTEWVPSALPPAPGAPGDRRWAPGSGEVTIDEFNDGALDPAWVMAAHASIPALPSLARPRYVEGADVLSVKYGPETGVGSGTADGGTTRHHALVRPLSGLGGALAVGDGIVTAFTPMVRGNANYRMAGLIFSTTDASGAGAQLYCRWWMGQVGMRSLTNWGGDTNVGTDYNYGGYAQGLVYMRIVRLSSTTWRYDMSSDGVSWILGNTASTWAQEPTHIGFAESNWNTTTPSVVSYEFIRRVSGVA